MKSLLASAFLTALTATSAMAQVQFETRTFHTNLRIDADRASTGILGETVDLDYKEYFYNAAGLGIAAIAPVDETVEFGLGLSLARYNPDPRSELTQTVINAFTRINLVQSEKGKFYMLAGVSRQQLAQKFERYEYFRLSTRYSPLVNGDLGIGASYKLGQTSLGLEYKYTNTLAPGRSTLKTTFDMPGIGEGTGKAKIHDVVAEGQELALTLGWTL